MIAPLSDTGCAGRPGLGAGLGAGPPGGAPGGAPGGGGGLLGGPPGGPPGALETTAAAAAGLPPDLDFSDEMSRFIAVN